MKVLNLVAVMFISLLLFSCKKTDDLTQPSSLQQGASSVQEDARQLLQLDPKLPKSDKPFYNLKNARQVQWNDMPAELRNAKPIESKPIESMKKEDKVSSSSVSYQWYEGPWGGTGGTAFSYYPWPSAGSSIYAIAIRSDLNYVHHLTVWYKLGNGSIVVGGDRGGFGGYYSLLYFAPDEYIYYVAGRSGTYLNRLTLYTNYKYFSFGGNGGTSFGYSVPWGFQALGFFGRSGSLIDQIGFYIYTRR